MRPKQSQKRGKTSKRLVLAYIVVIFTIFFFTWLFIISKKIENTSQNFVINHKKSPYAFLLDSLTFSRREKTENSIFKTGRYPVSFIYFKQYNLYITQLAINKSSAAQDVIHSVIAAPEQTTYRTYQAFSDDNIKIELQVDSVVRVTNTFSLKSMSKLSVINIDSARADYQINTNKIALSYEPKVNEIYIESTNERKSNMAISILKKGDNFYFLFLPVKNESLSAPQILNQLIKPKY